MLKCDFCSKGMPGLAQWIYYATPGITRLELPNDRIVLIEDDGVWTACQECHDILQGDYYDEDERHMVLKMHASASLTAIIEAEFGDRPEENKQLMVEGSIRTMDVFLNNAKDYRTAHINITANGHG